MAQPSFRLSLLFYLKGIVMQKIQLLWNRFEEAFIALILALMALTTFVYVILNNIYVPFYSLGDHLENIGQSKLGGYLIDVGDFVMELAQAMTWSNAFSHLLFAWLIFFALAYGVRTAGHIGVDIVVTKLKPSLARTVIVVASLLCLTYSITIGYASLTWVLGLYKTSIFAEDLSGFGVKQWHIAAVVPLGCFMMFVRFFEILIRIVTNRQANIGLADEAADALKNNLHQEELQ